MRLSADFDGFISKRDGGDDFAKDLKVRLRNDYGIYAAEQINIGKVDAENHERGVRTIIGETCFTVVVISHEGLDPSFKTEEGSYQLREIRVAREQREARKGSRWPVGIFFVHLTDDKSTQAREDMEALLEKEAGVERHSPYFYWAPESKDDAGSWDKAVDDIAASVRDFLRRERIPPCRPSASEIETVEFTAGERAYLEAHLGSWLKGQIDPPEAAGAGSGNGKYRHSTLFEFDPNRCLLLEGTGIADKEGSARRRPLLEYVFEETGQPTMLLGTPGAGKSTTLTVAAALCAGRADPDFRDRASDLFATEMGAPARDRRAFPKLYMPVLMRCTRLAEAFKDNDGPAADRRVLMDVILGTLSPGGKPTAADREALADRLREQPYMLILDGLDEVSESRRADRILRLVRGLYERRDDDGFEIEVLISSRPVDLSLHDIFCVQVAELKIAQIQEYFRLYANSIQDVSALQREKFERDALHEFHSYETATARGRENMQDFLSLPFNLNCFCWMLEGGRFAAEGQTPLTQTDFFRTAVECLISDTPITSGETELTPDHQRIVLRRLAYEALISGHGRAVLSFEEAKTVTYHTLSVIIPYQTGRKRFDAADANSEKLLNHLCSGTDLLVREGDMVRFGRHRFCEYLAGERIDSDALATAMLAMLDRTKLHAILPSLCFCYALRLGWHVEDYANNVLEGLNNRARDAVYGKNDCQEMLQWTDAAIECLRSGVETGFSDDALIEPSREGYDKVRRAAVELLRECDGKVDRAARAATITNLLRIGRRPKPAATVVAVRDLFEDLVPDAQKRWKEFTIGDPDGSSRRIEVERTPVLVCEFEEFLSEPLRRSEEFWDHAPEEHRVCFDEAQSELDGLDPAEEWRSLRRNPGSPMTFVTWYEAVAYARWKDWHVGKRSKPAGFRLPTVEEMKQVCRQTWDGDDYPWRDVDDAPETVNCRAFPYEGTTPPGAFPARNGLIDLSSNVRVWTVDAAADGRAIWPPADDIEAASVFGGSWIDTPTQFHWDRPAWAPEPTIRENWIGLRLVRDIADPADTDA